MSNIVNLCHVPKLHGINFNGGAFGLARSHIQKMDNHNITYDRVVSCYRSPNNVYISCGTTVRVVDSSSSWFPLPCRLLFPLWILPALVPVSEVLCISNVTVAHFPGSPKPFEYVNHGNGHLKIKRLSVLCINKLDQNDTYELTKNFLSILKKSISVDEVDTLTDFESLTTQIALDIIHESPHTMFGSCRGISHFYQPPSAEVCDSYGDRILIVTLGYGYNDHPFHNHNVRKLKLFIDPIFWGQPGLKNQEDWLTHPWIVHEYAINSSFLIAQTTDENGIIINGATALAIRWLRAKWHDPEFKSSFDNLIVLIPYGGQYVEEEMIEITKATDEGIIIVCAAGDCREGGGDVVFPAALGTVISVGVAGTGPKGREVDVSVDFASRPAILPGVKNPVHLPEDCGIAAARIAGLLSLLLARINDIFKSTEHSIKDIIMKLHLERKKYMHACVIRELLVNEGRGMHDPQLGYGNGEDIIMSLLTMEKSHLLQRLGNVVISNYEITLADNPSKLVKSKPVSKSDRETLFFNLDGNDITVAVIDNFYIPKNQIKPNVTTFEDLGSLHGEQCAIIAKAICPNSMILCVNSEGTTAKDMCSAFQACLDSSFDPCHNIQIDIISCSIGCFAFHYDLCKAVNEAVRASKIIVCAAGNEGLSCNNTIVYPGRQGNILVVGGRDRNYSRAGFSSVGREMDFLAEAKQFLESTGSIRGTSFATPVVAGYIALLLQFIKEKMTTDMDKVSVWLENRWQKKSAFDAARNVYAMRELLKLFVIKPQEHAEKEGYGCLDFATLFPHYQFSKDIPTDIVASAKTFVEDEAKKKIQKTLQHFYKRDY